MNQDNASAIATVLGKVPSGLYILTARYNDQETGMLASWVMQAGFEPPMISVAVKSGRYVGDWLSSGASFAINLLGDGDKSLLSHFGRGFEPGQPAFDGVNVSRTSEWLPILADAVGYLLCRPTGSVDSGDHRIFLAEVTGGTILHESPPYIHVRKNGLRY